MYYIRTYENYVARVSGDLLNPRRSNTYNVLFNIRCYLDPPLRVHVRCVSQCQYRSVIPLDCLIFVSPDPPLNKM